MTDREAIELIRCHVLKVLAMLADDVTRQTVAVHLARQLNDLAYEASQRRTIVRRQTPYPAAQMQAINDALKDSHRTNWMLDAVESSPEEDYKTPVANMPAPPADEAPTLALEGPVTYEPVTRGSKDRR